MTSIILKADEKPSKMDVNKEQTAATTQPLPVYHRLIASHRVSHHVGTQRTLSAP